MQFDPKKLKKTILENVFAYVEDDFSIVGGKQEKHYFFDFSSIQPLEITNNKIMHNNKEYNVEDITFIKYYKDLDPSFKRLYIYSDKHHFKNRCYYYSKELQQIRIFKHTADRGEYYMNLTPTVINKKKAFSCVADTGKTVIVFIDLIVDHDQSI